MPTDAEIRAYWDRKAGELGTDPAATMKDVILRGLELEAVARRLHSGDSLIDVGCGNAWGSLVLAEHCRSVLGVDYSPAMVEAARRAIVASGRENVSAEQADVLQLDRLGSGRFSAACSIRCLINLPRPEEQHAAIAQLAAVLAPGGRLLLIEGVAEGFAAMNAMREAMGLPAIQLNWHNRLFPREELHAWLAEHFELEEVVDFGEYYFVSRIVHPLAVAPEPPRFEAPINEAARRLWQSGVQRGRFAEMSTLALHVCRKR